MVTEILDRLLGIKRLIVKENQRVRSAVQGQVPWDPLPGRASAAG